MATIRATDRERGAHAHAIAGDGVRGALILPIDKNSAWWIPDTDYVADVETDDYTAQVVLTIDQSVPDDPTPRISRLNYLEVKPGRRWSADLERHLGLASIAQAIVAQVAMKVEYDPDNKHRVTIVSEPGPFPEAGARALRARTRRPDAERLDHEARELADRYRAARRDGKQRAPLASVAKAMNMSMRTAHRRKELAIEKGYLEGGE
jgi:hypothetical protein